MSPAALTALVVATAVVATALLLRALLNPLLTHVARKLLAPRHGTLSSVKLSLLPLALRIDGLSLRVDTAAAATAAAKPKSKKTPSFSLSRFAPLRVARVELRRAELVFTGSELPPIRIHDIELALDNIVTRRSLDRKVPSSLTLRARIQNSGLLTVLAHADALAEKPAFSAQAQIEHLDLADFADLVAAKAGVAPAGTFDCFATINSAHGVLSGAIKPIWRNAEIAPVGRSIGKELIAGLADTALEIFDDDIPGRDAVATVIPIKGMLTKPDPEIWPSILGVVRNAFVRALSDGFAEMPAPRERRHA